jgi:hypothetical protein
LFIEEEITETETTTPKRCPSEGGSYILEMETKHDRRMAPRPKLFLLKMRLQELSLQSRKIFPGLESQ